MENSANYYIEKLQLGKHPEGGWFREIYRSDDRIRTAIGERDAGTSIYYLLEGNDYSAFHRIKSDEIWHYYAGTGAVEILWIENGKLHTARLGRNLERGEHLQLIIPKNCWFAARLSDPASFALAGCSVAPGFCFDDFELADERILKEFPELAGFIEVLLKK